MLSTALDITGEIINYIVMIFNQIGHALSF
jgi:hypothetical protein